MARSMKKGREPPELNAGSRAMKRSHQERITVLTACAGLSVSGKRPPGVGVSWMFAIGAGEDGQVRGAGDRASHLTLDAAIFFFFGRSVLMYFWA